MAVLFDTRAYHRTLTEAGVSSDQADAHTRALETALEGGVATKQDIAEVRQDIVLSRKDVELLGRDLKIWTGGVGLGIVGIGLAAAKLLWK